MRLAKWIGVALAGCVLLLVALVLSVTLLVDPNRYKGRIETLVSRASGQPFSIRGDLQIAWYPWLAMKMGAARLGETPLVAWESASFGAKLIPLMRGKLIVSRIRLDGLRVRLEKDAQGRGNWEGLLAASRGSAQGSTTPEIAGLEIRDGTLDYVDVRTATHVALSEWQLDLGEWRRDAPFSLDMKFELRKDGPASPVVPVVMELPRIELRREPLAVSIPKVALRVANASLDGKVALESAEPLRAQGAFTLRTSSLRELLAMLAIGGPRPRDSQTLGELNLAAQWAVRDGSIAVQPIEMRLDATHFTGEAVRPAGKDAVLRFELRGDRIAMSRYVEIEDTGSEPFVLPTEALKALRVAGVVSFAEAQMAGATIRNARIRLETP